MNDYISREAVLQKFLERGSGYINGLTMRDIINEIPSADVQPIPQWISVDERLPKPFELVLCYCISTSGDLDFYMVGCINKHWGLLKGETFVSEKETHRIVAYWQPLPPRPTIDYCRFCNGCGADMRGGTENDT